MAALELVNGAFISGMAARDAAPVTAATAVPHAVWCVFFAMFPRMPRKASILAHIRNLALSVDGKTLTCRVSIGTAAGALEFVHVFYKE